MTQEKHLRFAPIVMVVCMLQACVTEKPKTSMQCPMTQQQPLELIRLYFGRSIPGRGPLTDGEWTEFASSTLSQQFPDGFTAYQGRGQWLDPSTGQIIHEDSVLIEAAVSPASDYVSRISTAVDTYKLRFKQESVGVTTEVVCGRF
jgi:hypothetical protein